MNFNLINYAIGTTSFAGIKNNLASTVAPTASNDSSQGYSVGSVWINSTSNTIYVATNIAVGAANWQVTTGGPGTLVQDNFTAVVDPSVTDDSSQGYVVGSHWVNTVNSNVFVATSVSVGAAVWTFVSNPSNAINNTTAVVAPSSTDDVSLGYSIGSIWIDTIAQKVYTAVSTVLASAVWLEITNTSTPLANLSAITPPVASSDSSLGYSIGSIWVDTVSNLSYIAVDITVGAAIWKRFSSKIDNVVAVIPPSVNDDSSQSYEIGSLWLDVPNSDIYFCLDSTVGNAKWIIVSPEVHNRYNGIAAPLATDDSTAGFDIGSIWIDSSRDSAFICTSNTVSNAVWVEITKPILHNLNAPFFPGPGNDSLQFYSIGSIWVDTVQNNAYMAVDVTPTNAIWVLLGSATPTGGGTVSIPFVTVNTIDPLVTNDIGAGYKVGSFWVNTVNNNAFISVDSTAGAAIWMQINGGGTTSAILDNFAATVAPTSSNDSSQGYAIGSHWIDTVAGNSYIAVGVGLASAVWVQTNVSGAAVIKNNNAATVAPTISNDSTALQGYSVGSQWVDVTNNNTYLAVDTTVGAAIWVQTNGVGNTSILVDNADGTYTHNDGGGTTVVINSATANAISPASIDSTGSIGVSTRSARQDHMHPTEGVSADASNALSIGTDGLHFLSTASLATPASVFDNIVVSATITVGTAITAPTVALGSSLAGFNNNTVIVLLNGIEQQKNVDAIWVSNTTFSLSVDIYAGDVVIIKP